MGIYRGKFHTKCWKYKFLSPNAHFLLSSFLIFISFWSLYILKQIPVFNFFTWVLELYFLNIKYVTFLFEYYYTKSHWHLYYLSFKTRICYLLMLFFLFLLFCLKWEFLFLCQSMHIKVIFKYFLILKLFIISEFSYYIFQIVFRNIFHWFCM